MKYLLLLVSLPMAIEGFRCLIDSTRLLNWAAKEKMTLLYSLGIIVLSVVSVLFIIGTIVSGVLIYEFTEFVYCLFN